MATLNDMLSPNFWMEIFWEVAKIIVLTPFKLLDKVPAWIQATAVIILLALAIFILAIAWRLRHAHRYVYP